MSLIIKTRIKDKGEIVWPPIGEPSLPEGPIEARAQRLEWLREQIVQAAEDTRTALSSTSMVRVHVYVSFRPDIMVDAA